MREIVLTDRGPKPIGPYSQAVKVNGLLFVSGQVALDPKTNEFLGGDIAKQTERVLDNLKGIIEAAGSKLAHVVKTTVFLKNISDFAAMNDVYARYFPSAPPARSTVEVARLPKDALVEMEVIATV
ncbi:MAG TPA: RidA family protein [Candidatus Methylomirabilis sp.]|nr:RidA family protein [Candidatus Methylomirabilis sp.]